MNTNPSNTEGAANAPKPVKKRTTAVKKPKYTCKFCKKTFAREGTVLTHKCAIRERMQMEDTRVGMYAMSIWKKWRERYHIRIKEDPSMSLFHKFATSSEYTSFMILAQSISSKNPVESDLFCDYILSNGIPSHRWGSDELREEWVMHYTSSENPLRGMQRTIASLIEWQNETGNQWNTPYENMSTGRFMLWVELGKLSPWWIYLCPRTTEILDRLTDEEFEFITKFISKDKWIPLMQRYQGEVQKALDTIQGSGL